MSTSVGQWDPEEVLEIGEVSSGITCVGYACSKHRRCHNPIAAEHRAQAANLLNQISSIDVSSPRVRDFLEPLGHLLLCDLWQHQEQLPRVVEEWCEQIESFKVLVAEWEQVIRSGSVAVREWTARLEQSMLNGDNADIQKTLKLLGLAQKRERGLRAQLADLETSNAELNLEMESLHTQLAHSANDSVFNIATPVTSPTRAREPSADSYPTFRHRISVGGDYQSPHGHIQNLSHRIRIQFELQSESVAASQQPYPQNVSQPERFLFCLSFNL